MKVLLAVPSLIPKYLQAKEFIFEMTGFGWGVVMYDFNNDTRQDYLIAQNYARFPGVQFLELYPGRLLQQFEDGRFGSVEKAAGLVNENFGIAPVVTDFNNDGWPDVVLADINGTLRAFLNNGGTNTKVAMKTITYTSDDKRFLLAGAVGVLGAILVGIGEFSLQFTPQGGYEASDYHYFADISYDRPTIGHFLSVLSAPLYLVGYWHLGQVFVRGGSRFAGRFITQFGGYAFVIGNAWLGVGYRGRARVQTYTTVIL